MVPSISPERLSELVGFIYDAAINPACWPVAMDAIRIELHAANATLNLQEMPSGELITNVTCNVPAHYLALMDAAGPDVLEQWGGAAKVSTLPLDEPAVLSHVNPGLDVMVETTGYAAYFARPQGIVDVIAIGLARDSEAIGTIAFGRHKDMGKVGEREIALARLLIPHLQRAATINRMLDRTLAARASFEATLDQVAVPILLVDSGLRLVHSNPAARQVLDRGEPLRLLDGIVSTTAFGVSNALGVAVAQAVLDESLIGRKGLGIPVRYRDGTMGFIHVLPLRNGRAPFGGEAVAAFFVAKAGTSFVAPTEIVATLFGLTATETRVFDCIVNGKTIMQAARTLGVERSTIKTHLLHLYDKIGVRRQAELVQIAASLTLPILL